MLFQQSVNKIKIIKMCIYLIVLALIFKVGYIQIIDRKNIYDKALESWQRSFPVQANRGKYMIEVKMYWQQILQLLLWLLYRVK